jgi:hypothetical protein
MAAKRMINAMWKSEVTKRNKEAAGYVESTNGKVREANKRAATGDPAAVAEAKKLSFAHQDYLGITKQNQKSLTPQKREQYAEMFSAAKTAQQTGLALQRFEESEGAYARKGFDEMVKYNKVDPLNGIALHFPGAMAKAHVLNIASKEEAANIQERYKTKFPNEKDHKKLFESVTKTTRTLTDALNAPGADSTGSKYANRIHGLVLTEAERLIGQENVHPGDAAKIALDSLFEHSTGFFEEPATKSKIQHPVEHMGVPVDDQYIYSYIRLNSTREALDRFDVVPPFPAEAIRKGKQVNISAEAAIRQWRDQKSEAESIEWVALPNGVEYQMRIKTTSQNGRESVSNPAMDRKGNNIVVPLEKIIINPSQELLDQVKKDTGSWLFPSRPKKE